MAAPQVTLPPTAPNKYGGDPVAFDAAMQAFLNWMASAVAQQNAQAQWENTTADSVQVLANAAQADRVLVQNAKAAIDAQSPVANAAAAAAAAAAAQGYASLAQATNPDAPLRLNPRTITTNTTIPSAYNASSVGPVTVAEGVTVTVSNSATWSIH